MTGESQYIDYILSPTAIREQTSRIYRLTQSGDGLFELHENKLDALSDYVIEVIKNNYPAWDIPCHSRWRHFKTNRADRLIEYERRIDHYDTLEKARTGIDLIMVSVLLDAGAGAVWKYYDEQSGHYLSRSEGLAIASMDMFLAGAFSATENEKHRVHGSRLSRMSEEDIARHFQVSATNPLAGVAGRAGLLRSLGGVLSADQSIFPHGRPGDLVDYCIQRYGTGMKAAELLKIVLLNLSDIWPGRLTYRNKNLGDVWAHSGLGQDEESYVPFHKLSQWLTYSLIETLERGGFEIKGVSEMTGLAEYRNGGLFIDGGVLELKDEGQYQHSHPPESQVIVEWRALTVQLLDRVGQLIREKLNKTEQALPLVKILEGGTWAAGRKLAGEKRENAEPPIRLESDGTVF